MYSQTQDSLVKNSIRFSGPTEQSNTPPSVWIAFLFFACNFLLKVWGLTDTDINADEPFSVAVSQLPVGTIFQLLFKGNNPPLHELILHYWTAIFGLSPLSIRFLPCLFSSISASLLFWLGSRFFNLRIGIIAALLFTFSSFGILIAHACRAYSLANMLGLLSMLLFLYFLENKNRLLAISLIVVNALIFYTHYFALWIPIVQWLYLCFRKGTWKERFSDTIFQKLGLLWLISPGLYFFILRVTEVATHSTWITTVKSPEAIYNLLWTFSNAPVVTVIFLLLVIASIYFYYKESANKNALTLIVLWFVLPLMLTFLISLVRGFFLDRYLYIIAPAYYLLIAQGIEYLSRLIKKDWSPFFLTVPVIAMILSFKFHEKSGTKNEISRAVSYIEQNSADSILTLVCPDWFDKNYAYYYDKNLLKNALGLELHQDELYLKSIRKNLLFIKKDTQLRYDSTYKKILYLDYNADFHYPDNKIKNWIEKNYLLSNSLPLQSTSLRLLVYHAK